MYADAITKAEAQRAVSALPPTEQLELIEEAWEHLAPQLHFGLTQELETTLETRRDAAIADPASGKPVEDVHSQIRAELRRSRQGE